MKVSNNSSTGEVARIGATGGQTISLRGVDFQTANQYQEFPMAFNFPSNETFLTFEFWRSGTADVYVDAVTIFTAPQSIVAPLTWAVPGGNYRGQGVWLRYTDDSGHFSPLEEADLHPQRLSATPATLQFLVGLVGKPPQPRTVQVLSLGCTPIAWDAEANAQWLQTQRLDDNTLQIRVDYDSLAVGVYNGEIAIQPADAANGPAVHIPVSLQVIPELFSLHLPLLFDNN